MAELGRERRHADPAKVALETRDAVGQAAHQLEMIAALARRREALIIAALPERFHGLRPRRHASEAVRLRRLTATSGGEPECLALELVKLTGGAFKGPREPIELVRGGVAQAPVEQ